MVVVAQLVRAPDCGSGGRRFEPDLPPLKPEEIQALFISGFLRKDILQVTDINNLFELVLTGIH
jgi:hypothetical protein